jgi:hypothetical protein
VIKEFQTFVHGFLAAKGNTPFGKAVKRRLSIGGGYLHSPESVGHIYSEKSGPNGPLTASAHLDWCSIRNAKTHLGIPMRECILQLEEEMCQKGISDFHSLRPKRLWEGFTEDEVSGGKAFSKYPGKISQINEKSGKVRLVASPDYFSQQAMKPIHNWLMDLLKTIPMDCTFDQRSSIPKIAQWQDEGRTVYSVDQSSCTDLFPMDCQTIILEEAFSNNLASRVRTVMCDREWEITLPSGKTTTVRWGVGQPMGIFGSWPLMAVTHHLLVQYCHWRASGRKSFETFRDYVICGDDIVIGRKAVAESYLKVVKLLGMKVNLAKSHVSGGKTSVDPVSEFAKITIWKGKPLHPVRPNMILSSVKDWRYAVPLLIDLADHTGFAARRKLLVSWISKNFPTKKKFLLPLLTVPVLFGGVGLSDSDSLLKKFTSLKTGQIHPWILYLGNKIRSEIILENQLCAFPRENLAGDVLRQHPIKVVRDDQVARYHLYGYGLPGCRPGDVPSVQAICQDLLENGLERYRRFFTGTGKPNQCPGPQYGKGYKPLAYGQTVPWDDTAKKRQLENRTLWEKSLRRTIYWKSPVSLLETWLPTTRSTSPELQYALVSRLLTGLKSS